MFKKQFILSLLFSALGMFFLSYFWHGYVLHDFLKNGTPRGSALLYKIGIYMVMGFAIAKTVTFKFVEKRYLYMPLAKFIVVGIFFGVVFFIISTIKSISLDVPLSGKYLLLNFCWQVLEQAIGGLIVAIVHRFVFDPDLTEE